MPLLFSYGTLQQPDVQVSTFGRRLTSWPDALIGYEQSTRVIEDEAFVRLSGKSEHAIVRYTGHDAHRVVGVVLEVTEADVRHADAYEPAGYVRVLARVASARTVWVYVDATAGEFVTIRLSAYDPTWPALYAQEAERLRHALGTLVRQLEHVGSTAVPDLSAKPIIDIVLVVTDSSDERAYVPALEDAGYVLRHREPHWFEHRFFKGPDTDVNVHVFSVGCPEIDRMLSFRNLLRADPAARGRYEECKRDLASRPWPAVQAYADAKTDVVQELLALAKGP